MHFLLEKIMKYFWIAIFCMFTIIMVKNIIIFPLGGGKPTQILTNGKVKPMAKILQSCPLN